MHVGVPDRNREGHHPSKPLQVTPRRVTVEGISDAAEADNATHLLVLLVAGGAEHLIEVLLVESAAVLPIEPFDHERRESGEVVDRRRELS